MSTNELTIETKADEAANFGEYQAVINGLMPYLDGARAGDGEKAASALFDHARVVGSMDGQFAKFDIPEFKQAITDLGEAPDVEYRIAWVDISGPAAAVKVELINWLGFRFTDFFILYKHEGEWKVSGKVYDSHSRN